MAEKNLRVFLDSSVLLSGLFSDRGAPRLILDIFSLRLPSFTALTGAYNIAEVERNLTIKLPAALPIFKTVLDVMRIEVIRLPQKKDLKRWAGLTVDKNAPILASAFLGNAHLLVTGDKRHLLKIHQTDLPFKIIAPAEFIDEDLPRFLR